MTDRENEPVDPGDQPQEGASAQAPDEAPGSLSASTEPDADVGGQETPADAQEEPAPAASRDSRGAPAEGEGVGDLADEAIESAQGAIDDLQADADADADTDADGDDAFRSRSPDSFNLPHFENGGADGDRNDLDLLSDVNLHVKIELGRTRMYVEDVLRLRDGAVVELDKLAGDPVDIYVNDRLVARGEVLIVNDNFCVRINEILGKVAKREAS